MEHSFMSGSASHPVSVVELTPATPDVSKLPIVLLHGGFHTGQAYLGTPDGRLGWAQLLAQRGHRVLVPDWPGHGRSPGLEHLAQLRTLDVAQSLRELLRGVGPAIVLAHSAAGPLAWWLAENQPAQVAAILGIAPGSPANLLPALPDDAAAIQALRLDVAAGCPIYSAPGQAVTVDVQFIRDFWANGPRFPQAYIRAYADTVVPESPLILNERFNIGGVGLRVASPAAVGQRPILIVTGEQDQRHPKSVDGALAAYLGAEFLWLPDVGIHGNGHMLMIEDNSHEIAALLLQWLQNKGL